ncbi:unnamed protein product [Adineta ricciae]|uniref:Uncharacterized protein n=1 Tax=Adineta ricciae TaxID=249248 RepID=A0A815LJD2_ADIRI|nr:unnamed protein product [Adineta ricciae]
MLDFRHHRWYQDGIYQKSNAIRANFAADSNHLVKFYVPIRFYAYLMSSKQKIADEGVAHDFINGALDIVLTVLWILNFNDMDRCLEFNIWDEKVHLTPRLILL